MNIIHVLLGVCILNRKYELGLGLEEVLYANTLKPHNLGRYYLVIDAKSLQLVMNLPTTIKNKHRVMCCCLVHEDVQRIPCSEIFG